MQVLKLLARYQTTMLVSVEFISECELLKPWGCSSSIGNSDYYGIVADTIESSSSFQMPPELHGQLFIWKNPKWTLSRLPLQYYCKGRYRVVLV